MDTKKRTKLIKDAQEVLKEFSRLNNATDFPSVDKFDHLHEELIEMSRHLRYKDENERRKIIVEKRELFVDGVGDLFFGLFRLANQLNVDIEDAFNEVKTNIFSRYNPKALKKSGKSAE